MASITLGGYIPDPPKAEDRSFDALRARLPVSQASADHTLRLCTPVSHQGNLRACSANVTADALELLMGVRGQVTQLSRLFIYFNARTYHSATDKDGGTYLRMAFEAIKRLGVCKEDLWPYVEANVNLRPPLNCYREANAHKVTGFYRINATGTARADAVEAAIRGDHPVTFGTQIGAEFEGYAGKSDAAFEPPSKPTGRHAMLLCGVRRRSGKREFMVRNSWGEDWGLNGYAWLSEPYIASDTSRDLWVPTLMAAV